MNRNILLEGFKISIQENDFENFCAVLKRKDFEIESIDDLTIISTVKFINFFLSCI